MKVSKSLLTLGLALACAAITFSLAMCAQAQTSVVTPSGTLNSNPQFVVSK
ncbi:MAG: hypothetical protein WBX38_00935 [Candidatus Sulfotelmatobacter sp.]